MLGYKILATEGELQIRTDSFYIRGKHDLIAQDPSGKLALLDWKTGRAPEPSYYEDFLNQKIQLGIYAVWMRHQFKSTSVRGTAVFLRDNECGELSEVFTPTIEQEVLDYLYDWRSRLNELSSYPPIPNKLCNWCGWNPMCSAYGDRGTPAFEKRAEAQETYSEPATKKRSPCFVATCVFESADAPEVQLLKRYRDQRLIHSRFGNVLIRVYETTGPIATSVFRRTSIGKKLIRIALAKLVVPVIRKRLNSSASDYLDNRLSKACGGCVVTSHIADAQRSS